MKRFGFLAALLALTVAGCGDEISAPAGNEMEAVMSDWLNFKDVEEYGYPMGNSEYFHRRGIRRPVSSLPGGPGPVAEFEVQMRQRATRFGGVDVAFRALNIEECPTDCLNRRCFGAEIYYRGTERLYFQFASPNEDHDWDMFGSTPPESQWLDQFGNLHARFGGLAMHNVEGLDEFPRLAMLHFDDIQPQETGGTQSLFKFDNTDTDGWCLMDGTPGLELEVNFWEVP
jgi:hypothetical protein